MPRTSWLACVVWRFRQEQAVAFSHDTFFLGLYNPRTPTVHSLTTTYQELVRSILEEVRSHSEFDTMPFTTIQVLHDTIDAPHTDDSLYGTKSIAMGLGEYVSGPLRVDGGPKPIHIRNRAVAYDGHKIPFVRQI